MNNNKDMREIVKKGYEEGNYDLEYRQGKIKIGNKEKEFFEQLLKNLPAEPHVLDFGCSTGKPYAGYLIKKGCRVTGIDISQKHIDKARKNYPQATYITGDFSKYSPPGSFNAIISLYAIFHIPRTEHQKLFIKMRNLLEEKGRILITVGAEKGEFINKDWCGAKMAWSTYSPERYLAMLEKVGFEIMTTRREGELAEEEEYHFWILAEKK